MNKSISKNRLFFKIIEVILILIIFGISLAVRIPNIDRHLAHGHEWITAHTLIQQRIWWEDGALKNGFRFIFNFPNEADKYIDNASMSDFDKENFHDGKGNYYYPSYPFFAVALPYLIFRAFSIYPDVLPIQIFNLVIHLICAIFIYLIIDLLIKKKKGPDFPAVLGAVLYIILPINLWFHSNTYFVEIFVQLPFIVLIYLILLYFKKENLSKANKNIILSFMGLSTFMVTSSEWLGVLVSFFVLVYLIFNIKKSKDYIKAFMVVLFSTFFSFFIYTLQYSTVIGFKNFIIYLQNKFLFRTGASEGGATQVDFGIIGRFYVYGYFYLFVILILLLGFLIFNFRKFEGKIFIKKYGLCLYIAFFPSLLHQIIFLNFTSVHDYAPIKMSFFLILITSFILAELIDMGVFFDKFKVVALSFLIFFGFLASINMYSNFYVVECDRYAQPDSYYINGKFIAETAQDDEVVFFKYRRPTSPQIIFYAGRNFKNVNSIEEAKEWLKNSPGSAAKGIFVISAGEGKFERFVVEK